MKTKNFVLLVTLCLSLMTSSCKKEKTEEDYIVRVGRQAFGVYLNGQPWIPDYRDAGSGIEPITVSMFATPSYMWIYGQKSNEEISLYIPPPLKTGRVSLNTTTFPWPSVRPNGAYGMYEIYSPAKEFMTNNIVTGYIDIISCDTTAGHIEGKFEFEAINSATSEKVRITNGYFKRN